jgi:hypothetical protein
VSDPPAVKGLKGNPSRIAEKISKRSRRIQRDLQDNDIDLSSSDELISKTKKPVTIMRPSSLGTVRLPTAAVSTENYEFISSFFERQNFKP